MGCDTELKARGHVSAGDLCKYLAKKYGKVGSEITRYTTPIGEIDYNYKLNPGHEKDDMRYRDYGYIDFKAMTEEGKEVVRSVFYYYSNTNPLENLEYYKELGLEEMVLTETTTISLGAWGDSVDILKDIAKAFGGGWLDENDCDEYPYYYVEGSSYEKQIKPEDSLGKMTYMTPEAFENEYKQKIILVD